MDGHIYKSVEYQLVHLLFRYCITVESGIVYGLISTCTVDLFHLSFDSHDKYSLLKGK